MSWRTENDGFIKTWAQDVRNSYKVRLKYVLIPKGVQTDVRFIDTPYRFQTYQEAREYAKELFPCYSYVVEGSPDNPNFNETQFVQRTTKNELLNTKFYDIYGVKRSYMKEPLNSREMSIPTVSNSTNSNRVKRVNKLTVEDEIEKRLADIEVLRLKLDEKEAELKHMKNSSNSKNNKNSISSNSSKKTSLPPTINPVAYNNSKNNKNNKNSISSNSSNSSKKAPLPPTINSKRSNTSKLVEQPPPY